MRSLRAVLVAALLGAPLLAAESDRFHPPFVAYDADGRLVRDTGQPVNSARSCASCHDTTFIRSHDLHARKGVEVDCLACHVPAPGLPTLRSAFDAQGRLPTAQITLQTPANAQCLACHGSGGGPHPLMLPDRYLDPNPSTGRHPEHLSRDSGTIYSAGSRLSSRLNLVTKDDLDQPWDLHAARLVTCVDCHHAPNKPGRQRQSRQAPAHLTRDPRQLSTAAYLRRPDHGLASAACVDCHDPSKGHAFLPYPQRHFEQLDCRACHVPTLHAPVLRQEDRALPDAFGRPRREWRNLEGTDDDPLNTRLVRAFQPLLASVTGADGTSRIRPVNVVTERAWHGADGREVDYALVRQASAGAASADDVEAMRTRLLALGVQAPVLKVRTRIVPIAHGVQEGKAVLRGCLDCHSAGGRLDTPIALGSLADPADAALVAPGAGTHLYLPGLGRQLWSTRLGSAVFLLTALGVLAHAFWRWRTQSLRGHLSHEASTRVYLYSAYERFWHWTMAASTLGLVLTGLEIHFTGTFSVLGFGLAVSLHNAMAVLLLGNAALSLFYHLSTGGIRQFIPPDENLRGALLAQARYYLQGIFTGAAHPVPKTVGRKMNPMQQLTYLALLNILLPFQIISGILIWGAERWPEYSAAIGGLAVVTPLHNLGSWLFMSFTLGHIYLTTTGHTLTSNLQAMVDGWDQIAVAPAGEPVQEDRHGGR
jgi:thiosulfate reductase cytochrome b subunit